MAERVEINSVFKRYPGGNEALKDISLTVEPGELLVLLGPSGSGKTTLLRCLAGIERITAGSMRIGDRLVADGRAHRPPEQRDLSMVFQDYALWPHMIARDNVALALRRHRLPKEQRIAAAAAMLERVGLGQLADRYPNQLSGGEQQRVALARALVGETGLLLCDEPLSNLDADLRERLRIEISSLVRAAGATTIYITHDQAEAFALADKVGVLERGRLVQHGPPEAIYRTPATPFVARFTGLAGVLSGRLGEGCAGAGGPVSVEVPSTVDGHSLELVGTATGELPPGAAVQVMLRPTAARICRSGSRPAVLRGIVRDCAFHGRGYDYVIEIGPGLQLTGVFDRRRFARGEVVDLFIHPAGSLVFSHDGGAAAPPVAPEAVVRAARPGLAAA